MSDLNSQRDLEACQSSDGAKHQWAWWLGRMEVRTWPSDPPCRALGPDKPLMGRSRLVIMW